MAFNRVVTEIASECNSTFSIQILDCTYCCLSSGFCGGQSDCNRQQINGYLLYSLIAVIVVVMIIIVYVVAICRMNRRSIINNKYVDYFLANLFHPHPIAQVSGIVIGIPMKYATPPIVKVDVPRGCFAKVLKKDSNTGLKEEKKEPSGAKCRGVAMSLRNCKYRRSCSRRPNERKRPFEVQFCCVSHESDRGRPDERLDYTNAALCGKELVACSERTPHDQVAKPIMVATSLNSEGFVAARDK